MSKKRRARTRRQSQIRRQEQIRRESLGRRDDQRPSDVRAEERRARNDAEMALLASRSRALTRLLILSLVCSAYGIGLWIVQLLWRDTLKADYPGVWTGLLIGLGVAVALCWIPGLILTVRDRAWFYVIVIVVPFTTIPALMYYCFTRRQAVRRQMSGQGGGVRPARRPARPQTTQPATSGGKRPERRADELDRLDQAAQRPLTGRLARPRTRRAGAARSRTSASAGAPMPNKICGLCHSPTG